MIPQTKLIFEVLSININIWQSVHEIKYVIVSKNTKQVVQHETVHARRDIL